MHKGVFIPGATVAAVFFVASLIADRMLRNRNRLPGFLRRRENGFSITSIIFGFIAALALVLLTIFDANHHSHAHWAFTIIFIVGVAFNGIFFVSEINSLSHDHYHIHDLRKSRNIKMGLVSTGVGKFIPFHYHHPTPHHPYYPLICAIRISTHFLCLVCYLRWFLVFAITMGILMGVCDDQCDVSDSGVVTGTCPDTCDPTGSTAAVFEWIIAFIFSFYVATFALDLEVAREGIEHEEALEAGRPKPAEAPPVQPAPAPVGGSGL